MRLRATLAGEAVELRNGRKLEVMLGEPLLLPPAVDVIELRAGPAGSTPSHSDGAITIHTIGRHTYWLTVNGERMDVELVACEPGLAAFLGAQHRTQGHGGVDPFVTKERKIRLCMRSLANHPSFSGRIADCCGANPELNPANHGC